MRVLLATTDPIRLSFLMALLRDAGCAPLVMDGHISAIEGGIGIFPRRLAVPSEQEAQARRVLAEAGETDGLR
ncbi:putative signal transducing protein [Falsiroseomonas sp. E2-1-a4]|uniref:putative signal transducing protein n=1 Tax=Falsiroseomonas sp. E2-1-a4 TaxID=3239299 RepID=UPI003F3A9C78